jgi:hypothetical protein
MRFQAARILLHAGKTAQARATLAPIAFSTHSEGEGNFAAKLVRMIDAGEPAEKVAAARPSGAESDGGDAKGGDTKSQ